MDPLSPIRNLKLDPLRWAREMAHGVERGVSGLVKQVGPLVDTAQEVVPELPFELRDRVDIALTGLPKGPFPAVGQLKAKFPKAGLPDKMVGTTIDYELLARKDVSADGLMGKMAAMGMNTVRLGAYWNEIQPNGPKDANFKRLDAVLAAAQKHGIKVVLSVGAKAPSWPEFHAPKWARPKVGKDSDVSEDPVFRQRTLDFVKLVANHVADHPAIAMWQVENEPLDHFGADQFYFDDSMIAEEIQALRQADGNRRPVMINCLSIVQRGRIDQAFALADVVGLDVYSHMPMAFGGYTRTTVGPAYALEKSKETGKPAMIAELQADNWAEYDANAQDITNLTRHLKRMGYTDFLFWRLKQNVEDEARGDSSLTQVETQLTRELLATDRS